MTIRLLAATLVALTLSQSPASARDLTVIGWGGAPQEAQREAYFKPFATETGIRVIDDSWSGGIGVLRARVEAGGDPGWDVVEAEAEEVLVGCADGLFEPIDWSKIPDKERLIPAAVSECGVGTITWSTGIAYDQDKLGSGAVSVADFFDLKRFPGKRAIRKGPKYALELALIGDGVPADKVYEVLRTPEGVDRAFAKLNSIKSDLLYFESGAQSIQLLASGEATMVLTFNARVTAANKTDKRNFRFIWPGSIYAVDSWVILRNSPNKEAAMKFLDFASRTAQQEMHTKLVAYGPTNLDAMKAIPEDIAKELSTYAPNMEGAISLDADFWADNIQPLTERFNVFVAQ
jgi:putative spermidine/putrescine transport system substrate-binding protein